MIQPPPADAPSKQRVLELQAELEEVAALELAANYAPALARAEALLVEAEALGWRPLVAEVHFVIGDLHEQLGDYERARASLEEAFYLAGDTGHDLVALRAASKLTWTLGVRLYERDAALAWGRMAAMFVERLALAGSLHEAHLLNALGAIHFRRQDYEEALANYTEAYEIRKRVLGYAHPSTAASLSNVGLCFWAQERYDKALSVQREALEIRRTTLGPEHPDAAASLANIAIVLERQDKLDDAIEAASEAQRIFVEVFGEQHPAAARSFNNLGVLHEKREDYREALRLHRKALKAYEATLDRDNLGLAGPLTNVGNALVELGEYDEAIEPLERALAFPDQSSRRADHRAKNTFALARALWAQADDPATRGRALELVRSAREDYAEFGDGGREELAKVEAWLAAVEAP